MSFQPIDLCIYKNWVLQNLPEDEDYTSCWNLAMYIFDRYNLPTDDGEPIYNVLVKYPREFTDLVDGVYHFYYEILSESHHFTLIIKEDKVRLISTYGGQEGLTDKEFDKQEWMTKFINLFWNYKIPSIEDYKYLFNIKKYRSRLDVSYLTMKILHFYLKFYNKKLLQNLQCQQNSLIKQLYNLDQFFIFFIFNSINILLYCINQRIQLVFYICFILFFITIWIEPYEYPFS